MKTITADDFETEVLQAKLPVLIKFTADWCKPCQVLQPVLDKVATELEGQALLYKVDIDDSPKLATAYKVKSVPAMIVFKDGKVLNFRTGSTTPKDEIIAMFELPKK